MIEFITQKRCSKAACKHNGMQPITDFKWMPSKRRYAAACNSCENESQAAYRAANRPAVPVVPTVEEAAAISGAVLAWRGPVRVATLRQSVGLRWAA